MFQRRAALPVVICRRTLELTNDAERRATLAKDLVGFVRFVSLVPRISANFRYRYRLRWA